MATRYQREIRDLIETLNRPESRAEAAMHLRGLIDKVTLTPSETEDRLIVDLRGDLAGILSVATMAERQRVEDGLSKLQPVQQEDPQSGGAPDDQHDSDDDITAQAAVVAGGRSRRDLFSSQQVLVVGAGYTLCDLVSVPGLIPERFRASFWTYRLRPSRGEQSSMRCT